MKRLITLLAALAVIVTTQESSAQNSPQVCTPWTKNAINGLALTSSRSFEIERSSQTTSLGLLVVLVRFTDANSSVTQVGMTCTTSNDNNTTDHTIQACTTANGACDSDNASWDKGDAVTGPGTSNWAWRVDTEGYEDVECTFASDAGTPAAADVISVDYRECTKG